MLYLLHLYFYSLLIVVSGDDARGVVAGVSWSVYSFTMSNNLLQARGIKDSNTHSTSKYTNGTFIDSVPFKAASNTFAPPIAPNVN